MFLGENISLPSGVQRIEYLESSGTQYIDTGYKFAGNSSHEFEFAFSQDQNYGAILWGQNSGGSEVFFTGANGWINGANFNFKGLPANRLYPKNKYKVVVNAINGSANMSVNGTLVVTSTGNSNNYKELLFVGSTNDAIGNYVKMRYYSYKRYTNGTLNLDLIPVRVGQTGALYNKVNGQLLYNAGTGDFILGPDI